MKTRTVFLFTLLAGCLAWPGNGGGSYLYGQPANPAVQDNSKAGAETEVDYKAQDYRDPFDSNIDEMPAKQVEVPVAVNQDAVVIKPPEFEIQGVFWGASFAQAIIDNKVVKVGDSVKGAKITAISKEGIKILFSGKDFDLSVPGINQPASGKTAVKKKKTDRAGVKKDEKTLKSPSGGSSAEEEEKSSKSSKEPVKEPAGEKE